MDAYNLKKIIELLKNNTIYFSFVIEENKMFIGQYNTDETIRFYINIDLSNTELQLDDKTYRVLTSSMYKIFKSVRKNDRMTMTIEHDKLTITIITASKSSSYTIGIEAVEDEIEELEIPDTMKSIKSNDFGKMIRDIINTSSIYILEENETQLIIKNTDETIQQVVRIGIHSQTPITKSSTIENNILLHLSSISKISDSIGINSTHISIKTDLIEFICCFVI